MNKNRRKTPKSKRVTHRTARRPEPDSKAEGEAVSQKLSEVFTTQVVDEMRAQTGYNPRQRVITASRLMLTVVEAFLLGQTLGFAALRAIFMRRFGFVRPCPFQQRFKQKSAADFFRMALQRLVDSVVAAAGLQLSVSLGVKKRG